MQAEDWPSQGSVVCLRAAFTLEVSLLCLSGAAAVSKNFEALGGQVPTRFTGSPICIPRCGKHPSLGVSPKFLRELGKQIEM
jgi:hypothetical protein